jgi:hypothetical protein
LTGLVETQHLVQRGRTIWRGTCRIAPDVAETSPPDEAVARLLLTAIRALPEDEQEAALAYLVRSSTTGLGSRAGASAVSELAYLFLPAAV